MLQNPLDLIDVPGGIDGRLPKDRQHKLLHRTILSQFLPEPLRKLRQFQFPVDPVAELSVHHRVVDQIEIIADIIAQLLDRIDPHMNPGYLIGLSCPLVMT